MFIEEQAALSRITSLASEEVEDPAGLAPAELVPGLHQALVLSVLPQAPDLVALAVAVKLNNQPTM